MTQLCKCGCENQIPFRRHYKYYGFPEYIHGHNMRGKSMSNKTKAKLSKINTGKKLTIEQREKISLAQLGRKLSKKHKENIGKALLGRKFNEKSKFKISQALKGNKNGIGHKVTKEHKEKLKKIQWKGGKESYYRKIARKIMGLQRNPKELGGMDLIVHHIDGNIKNNSPENLKIMTRSAHTLLHWKQGDIRGKDI